MAYKLIIPSSVRKQIRALPPSIWPRVDAAIVRLGNDPRPFDSCKLRGWNNSWRVRVGVYRIIYTIKDDRLVIQIIRVGHRRAVYR